MVLMFLNVVLLGPDTERMLRVCRMYKNGISGISTMFDSTEPKNSLFFRKIQGMPTWPTSASDPGNIFIVHFISWYSISNQRCFKVY